MTGIPGGRERPLGSPDGRFALGTNPEGVPGGILIFSETLPAASRWKRRSHV